MAVPFLRVFLGRSPETYHQAGLRWGTATSSSTKIGTTSLPPLEGLRTPAKADLDKLSSLPQSAGSSFAAYLTGGAKSPQARLFEPSPGTLDLLSGRAKSKVEDIRESYIASVADTFLLSGDPVTFITSSGEGLVFLALSEQYVERVEPGSHAFWASGGVTAFSDNVKYYRTLDRSYLHQVALVIPPKGKGKIRILSLDGQLVGAGGS